MCDRAVVMIAGKPGIWCSSQGELARALNMPVKRLPLEKHYAASARRAEMCLCPVDFRRLSRLRGYRASRLWEDGYCGEWMLCRSN